MLVFILVANLKSQVRKTGKATAIKRRLRRQVVSKGEVRHGRFWTPNFRREFGQKKALMQNLVVADG